MVPQSSMLKRASNVQNLLQYAMPLWKDELTSNNQNFGNVEVTRNFPRGFPIALVSVLVGKCLEMCLD